MFSRFALLVSVLFAVSASAVVIPPSDDATTDPRVRAPRGTAGRITVDKNSRGWIRFDLSSLPAGTTASQISKATLRLYPSVLARDTAFHLAQPQDDWSEATLTHANAPAVVDLDTDPIEVAKTEKLSFVTLDVTSLVKAWLATPASNRGIVLVGEAGAAAVGFESKESLAGGNYPLLDVTLSSTPGSQGPKGDKGATGTVGPVGPQGIAGLQGPVGAKGAAGIQGPVGVQGPKGDTGPSGSGTSDFIYGDGSAGAFTATGTTQNVQTLDASNPQYTNFTVPSGTTLHVPSGITIRCTGKFTNAGTILLDAIGGAIVPSVTGTFDNAADFPLLGLARQATGSNSVLSNYGSYSISGKAFPAASLKSITTIGLVGGGSAITKSFDATTQPVNAIASGGGSIRVLAKGAIANSGVLNAVGQNGQASSGDTVYGPPAGGGGGGGVVILASHVSITQTGTINSSGGNGGLGRTTSDNQYFGAGGGGGGGFIRMLAPTVTPGTGNVVDGGTCPAQVFNRNTMELRSQGGGGAASAGNGSSAYINYADYTMVVETATAGLVLIDRCNPAALIAR